MPASRPFLAAPPSVRGPTEPADPPLQRALTLPRAWRLTSACTWTLAFAAGLPSGTLAQTPAQRAADPASPVMAMPAPAAPHAAAEAAIELPTDMERARSVWRRANERVAEFPRGHADLLRWEDTQPGTTAARPATASAGPALDMGRALHHSLRHRPDLFAHPGMNELERGAVQRAYVAHVREVQRAWISAVAARQGVRFMTESLEAASTGVELGQRMVRAGNWSQARLMREQLVEATARQAWASAQQAQALADTTLAGLLGQWDAAASTTELAALPAQLPELPTQVSPGPGLNPADVEAAVVRSHPTLAWQRLEAQRLNSALDPQRSSAWAQAVDRALQTGSTHPWQAPTLNDLRLLRDHTLERAVAADTALLATATARRAMARTAWSQLQARHASARLAQDGVLRLQTALEQETQLRYNGMLQSTWELLAQARERMAALDAAVQARRDFWLAHTDWQALLAGGDYEAPNATGTARPGAGATPAGH